MTTLAQLTCPLCGKTGDMRCHREVMLEEVSDWHIEFRQHEPKRKETKEYPDSLNQWHVRCRCGLHIRETPEKIFPAGTGQTPKTMLEAAFKQHGIIMPSGRKRRRKNSL